MRLPGAPFGSAPARSSNSTTAWLRPAIRATRRAVRPFGSTQSGSAPARSASASREAETPPATASSRERFSARRTQA